MGKRILLTVAVTVLSVGFATQTFAQGAYYDHVHLIATDQAEAVDWYAKHIGGERMDRPDRLLFGDVIVIFFKRDAGFEGSEGSSVDHIGFSFHDLGAKMATYEEAGVKILRPAREVQGKFKFGFIEDPWGTKIEVMEDHETIGFHHIHLRGSEPEKIFDWYEKAFGGERVQYKDMLPALKYGNVWLLVQGSRGEEPAATLGRAIDHISWGFGNLDEAAVELKSKDVPFTLEPRDLGRGGIKIAFVEGPGGVRIELVQRPGRE